jgi:hypothetical protein
MAQVKPPMAAYVLILARFCGNTGGAAAGLAAPRPHIAGW